MRLSISYFELYPAEMGRPLGEVAEASLLRRCPYRPGIEAGPVFGSTVQR